MENREKILNYIGVSKKARLLVSGSDVVCHYLSLGKVYLVFVANDASMNTKDKFNKKCFHYNVTANYDFCCQDLSKASGKEQIKVIGIIDKGIALSINKLLKEG